MTLSINGKTYEAGELVAYVENIEKENAEFQGNWQRLEKENAELREENKKIFNDWLEACNKYEEVNLKLTKAKEIIKTFLGFAEAFGYSPSMYKFIMEAEQFLSEVKK